MGMNFVGILKEILKAVTGICLKFLMPSASSTKTSEKFKSLCYVLTKEYK